METILLFYVLPLATMIILTIGEADFGDSVPYAFIPVLNILFAVICIWFFFVRVFQSKGKCTLGHSYVQTYDSESEKWKDGRMPMRISAGGYTKYCCSKCKKETTTSWSAF